MSATAEVRSVRVGGQLLRVAVRPGLSGPGSGSGGQPPRVPLLLVNGIGASMELLAPFVAALEPAIEVIRFDPPGVGGSAPSPRPYRFSGLCRLIARLLDELGHNQVDVLGISWGGEVAQHFAEFQRARCRPLVLVATATGALMVPARPSVLAHMVTPQRYLNREYLAEVPAARLPRRSSRPGHRGGCARAGGGRLLAVP
jgi:pimeloyl-ACP methyl ester carboxylesterase